MQELPHLYASSSIAIHFQVALALYATSGEHLSVTMFAHKRQQRMLDQLTSALN